MSNKDPSISREEALEHLAHIKTLTVQTKRYGKQTAPYLITWGIIWVVGYSVAAMEWYALIGWVWFCLAIIGGMATFTIIVKQKRADPMPAFLSRQMGMAWGAFYIIVGMFAFLIGMGFLEFTNELIGFYPVLLVAIMYLLLGVVIGKEIFFMGIWLGVLSAATAVWFMPYSSLIFAIIGGGSMIATGLMFLREGRQNG